MITKCVDMLFIFNQGGVLLKYSNDVEYSNNVYIVIP